MRKRNIQIIIRLDKDEHRRLCKLVKKSGLSQEAYIRHLIDGVVPNDAPPPDYFSMMKELHGIGNNLNQIAQKAHILNVIDVQRYDGNMRLFNQTIRSITNAVILPRKAGATQSPLCVEKERPRSGEFLATSGENDKRSVP